MRIDLGHRGRAVDLGRLPLPGVVAEAPSGAGRSSSEVLFSGQTALGPLLVNGTSWSVGALCLLVACKAIAYGGSLSSFRGGPTFPGLFIGAAGGLALSHLPGLSMLPAAGMGMGAMCAVMLGLPLTSVLVATLFLGADGITIMPLVIVAVVVAYVARTRLTAAPTSPNGQASQPPAPDKDRPMERGVAGPAEAVTSETDRPAA
jgi:H+/Cl- antiporter ClcA